MDSKPYIGRFAPSPSGSLHFGSLVAALASYLDARAHNGRWLVRVEDIDPPREQPGAAEDILRALEAYGMEWDGDVIYQSNRYSAYQQVIEELIENKLLYPCVCSRKKLAGLQGVYPGYCREVTGLSEEPHALRLKCSDQIISFVDLVQGSQTFQLASLGDFVIKRKDGLYAYQLAVTVDDAFQGITHIVRGVDLLDSTPRQLFLQSLLGYRHPIYSHVPVITEELGGNKLSKQNRATALPLKDPRPVLINAMRALGLQPEADLQQSTITEILRWGSEQWNIATVPSIDQIPLASLN